MAYTTINKSTDYFNTKLYAGNNTADTSITGIGHAPSFVWLKNRDNGTGSHGLFDAVRGVSKRLKSDDSAAEATASGVSSFNSDGFTLGTSWNQASTNFVSWNWKANGQGSANSDGTITTTYTSVDTTAGFSISKWTGTGSAATVGHGLGVAPQWVMVKRLDSSGDWRIYTEATGNQSQLSLSQTSAADSGSTMWNATSPTSTVFSIGTHANVNASSGTYVAYCFSNITGFSKVGSYTGNGNANGPFVYTGFKPAWLIIKRTNSTASWVIVDNQRSNPFNQQDRLLFPNTNAAEDGSGETYYWDFLSNGFKIRTTSGSYGNGNNDTYIYMAFAEAPLVGSNNVPATAR